MLGTLSPDPRITGTYALSAIVGALAVLTVAASAAQVLAGSLDVQVLLVRLAFGLCFLLGAAAAWWLNRRGAPRRASFLLGLVVTLATGAAAAVLGAGVHGVSLGGLPILIVATGVLAGTLPATGLALLYLLIIGALAALEAQGWISGARALQHFGLVDRVVNLLLVGLAGWLAALYIGRIVSRSLAAAQAEASRLAAMVRVSNDWTWRADRRGRMTWIDSAFESRTGRRVEEFLRIDRPGGPVIQRDAEWARLIAAMRARQAFRDCIVTFRCPDGSELCVMGSGEPMFDRAGELVGWWGASRNVTCEVQATRARQRTQNLLDQVFHLSPDAICVVNLHNGAVRLANPSFLGMVGRPEAQVLGRTGVELGLWEDWGPAFRLGDALAREPVVRDLRLPARTHDGRVLEMQVAAARMSLDDEPMAMIVGRDITVQERSRRETEAILDHASVGIAFVRERHFSRVNPQFEALFGRPAGSLAGQPTALLFNNAASYDGFAARTDAAHAAGALVDQERECLRPDGSRLQLRLRGRAVDAAQLREAGSIWIAEDIGPRRAAERELAEAKDTAERASQAKSAFLATISHEIRTPLNGVLGLARLLREPALPPAQQRDYLDHLVRAAEGLEGLLSDVLDLSKVEAGELTLEHIDFDVQALVRGVAAAFEPVARLRRLALQTTVAPAAPLWVRGDPVRVRQILNNFLSNAVKFTERGEISVQLEAAPGGACRLGVRDTGPGLDAATAQRLFRPFVQGEHSTTRRFGGTGLGLAICKELAQRMGGTVGVESRPGEGALFWVELPLAPGRHDGAPTEAAALDPRDDGSLRGLQVLLVEDNDVNRLIATGQLERLGADVLQAHDGSTALEMARRHAGTLHVVLMDFHMPGMDGLEATRRLHGDPRTAHLPVVALTAAVLDQERRRAAAAGMAGFLAKPLDPRVLARTLAGYLPGTGSSSAAAAARRAAGMPGDGPTGVPAAALAGAPTGTD